MAADSDRDATPEPEPRAVAEDLFDRWIESGSEDGNGGRIVSIGRLSGVDGGGEPFEDVRYVDVYEVRDGLIRRLDVWNDLATEGIVDPRSRP